MSWSLERIRSNSAPYNVNKRVSLRLYSPLPSKVSAVLTTTSKYRSSAVLTAECVKKPIPPDQTNAENFYYLKQMSSKTPMVIVMTDGEEIRGWIEWYDKGCLKVNREGAPNLLVQKHCIKYLFKEEDLEQ